MGNFLGNISSSIFNFFRFKPPAIESNTSATAKEIFLGKINTYLKNAGVKAFAITRLKDFNPDEFSEFFLHTSTLRKNLKDTLFFYRPYAGPGKTYIAALKDSRKDLLNCYRNNKEYDVKRNQILYMINANSLTDLIDDYENEDLSPDELKSILDDFFEKAALESHPSPSSSPCTT